MELILTCQDFSLLRLVNKVKIKGTIHMQVTVQVRFIEATFDDYSILIKF